MKAGLVAAILLAASVTLPAVAQEGRDKIDLTGRLTVYGDVKERSSSGPLAAAQAVAPGALQPPSGATLRTDFSGRLRWKKIEGAATVLGAKESARSETWRMRLDELFVADDQPEGHRFTLGKRVVSWDIGYAFRPNDIIQDEARRALIQRTLEGRPLAMLEHYGADSSWAVAIASKKNRAADAHPMSPEETMLAARYYRRAGPADLYGFAGIGSRSRGTAGAAASWVLTDAVEVHGSYRFSERNKLPSLEGAAAINATSPYAYTWRGCGHQLVLGGTFTTASKLSLIVEGWYDGTAPSDAFWRAWSGRSAAIAAAGAQGVPQAAVAGNYGWQAQQLSFGPLRRRNLFARVSWSQEDWEPALDVLYLPGDGGAVVTAGLAWTSQRVKVEAGMRLFRGSGTSLLRQLPDKNVFFASLSASF